MYLIVRLWSCVLQDYSLAVVVSPKYYAAPLLHMNDIKVSTAVLVYLTSVVQMDSIVYFPYSGRRTQKGGEGGHYVFDGFKETK